jgi:hypothetical protein
MDLGDRVKKLLKKSPLNSFFLLAVEIAIAPKQ